MMKVALRGAPNILKPNPIVVSLVDYLSLNEVYWTNADFDKMKLKNENAWVEEEGKMKVWMIVGRAQRVLLGSNVTSKKWLIVLEEPHVVAQDFKKNLVMVETFFRNKLLHPNLEYLIKTDSLLRLQRDKKDFPEEFSFPYIFDNTESTPVNIGDEIDLDASKIKEGSIVACTAYARASTRGSTTTALFILDSVRLLGNEYIDTTNNVLAPTVPFQFM